MFNQKDELEKINVGNVLESLNENISEASPFSNYFRKFFGRFKKSPAPSTVSSTPGMVNEAEYIQRLNTILNQTQSQLQDFIDKLDLRVVKRNMSVINFSPIIHAKKRKPSEKPPVKLTGPPADWTSIQPPKGKPPINPIFEGDLRAWKDRSKTLESLMNTFSHNIQTYLESIAKDIGYVPMKRDLFGLIREFNKFPTLTPRTKNAIKSRLQIFATNYQQLQSWLSLFKRTEQSMEKSQKSSKKTP